MASCGFEWKAIRDLLVKEQFLNSCPKNLAVYLKEQAPKTLDDLSVVADHFLQAHNSQLCSLSPKPQKEVNGRSAGTCYNCHQTGHRAYACPKLKPAGAVDRSRKCFICDKSGHLARDCRMRSQATEKNQTAAAATLEVKREIPVLEPVVTSEEKLNEDGLPVVAGKVGENVVNVLRDTGCNGVVVRQNLVKEDQFAGRTGRLTLLDRSVIEAPIAVIDVSTPFYNGHVEALCIKDPLHDLIFGNVVSGGSHDGLSHEPKMSAVATRSQTRDQNRSAKPLEIEGGSEWAALNRAQFEKEQMADQSLEKLRSAGEEKLKGKGKSYFGTKDKLLYRFFQHPNVNGGKKIKQLVVPKSLRNKTMELAHETMMSGHMGIKKTTDRILSNFFWPGLKDDVRRFCLSCDICQRTLKKGNISKLPLQKMPLIDIPFKRVAVDIVGPIHPPSGAGFKYILTLVDYATRYPEAVALKNISTEDVAEGLLSMYSRLGIPEEILSDMGSQFISDCMKEVERLLKIRHLSTTPYHPQCNGLVEKFNGTLKSMLKKLCADQPKEWHRFLDALLFAYREVPQESTGFAPFELMYGRPVRGPMNILREIWSADNTEPEVLSSYRYVVDLRERLDKTFNLVKQEMTKTQNKYKANYDRHKVKQRQFQPGDFVLLLLPTDNNKLLMQWKGPFKVVEAVGPVDYKININGKMKLMHANLLKKYHMRDTSDLVTSSCCVQQNLEFDDIMAAEGDFLEFASVQSSETVDMVKLDDQLTNAELKEVAELLHDFDDVFSDLPGCTNLIEHEITLTSAEPVRSTPYAVPFSLRDGLANDIKAMMESGIIQPSNSPYASPVVLVGKKDGSNRLCIDYRKLNKITVFDPEPMTTSADVFEKLCNARYLTTIDLAKGYWQIPVAKDDVPKTAFVTHEGSYEFLRMPFGMINSSATFVRAMRKLLQGIDNVEMYIDDIIVHTCDWNTHIRVLDCFFRKVREAGMTIRPSKCVIGARKVNFLGHHVGEGVIGLHEENVLKIKNAPQPGTKKEVRSFLGLTGYYRDYIPNYAAIAAPLSDLTRKGNPNVVPWDVAQDNAFNALKASLATAPILKLPDTSKPFVLRCDASKIGLGAMLL